MEVAEAALLELGGVVVLASDGRSGHPEWSPRMKVSVIVCAETCQVQASDSSVCRLSLMPTSEPPSASSIFGVTTMSLSTWRAEMFTDMVMS